MHSSRADLLDQLLYLRDELALLEPLLPRLNGPLLEERPRPDVPSFSETLAALAAADAARLAEVGGTASALPPGTTVAEKLARFATARTALHDALAAHDWDEAFPSGEMPSAFVYRAIQSDAEALRTIGVYLFEAQKK